MNKNDEKTRNYFWVPAKKNLSDDGSFGGYEIDEALIEDFDNFKQEPGNRKPLSELLAKSHPGTSHPTISHDQSILKDYIYTSTWGTKQNYMLYGAFNTPEKLNTMHFFTTMAELANGKPALQEIIARYQLTDTSEDAHQKPLNDFLY